MKISTLVAILPKIQNGAFVYIKPIINIQIITKFKLPRVSALFPKVQNSGGDKLSRRFAYIQQP
jgi:hypothetical protein